MRVEHGVELTEMERGVPPLHVEQDRERDVAAGRDDFRIGTGELCTLTVDEDTPRRADPRCVVDHAFGARQRLLTGRVLVRIPRECTGGPGGREQLEWVEDVDREVSQGAASSRRRLQQRLESERADTGEPGVEDDEGVAGEVCRRKRCSSGETEDGGELGDVQDRLDDTADRDRGDDRPTCRLPAACPLGAVADVDGFPRER